MLLVVGGTTLIAAIGSPPQDGDVLSYHLSRVAHWIQNESVQHYATPDIRQLWIPPWSDYAVSQFMILSGTATLVNMVQWFAFVAIMIVSSRIAGLMGAGSRGQMIAAVFAGTLPFAIYQSTNAAADLTVAYWVICTVWILLFGRFYAKSIIVWILIGLVVGIGQLTKGTFGPYALPVLLWVSISLLRRSSFKESVAGGLVASALAILILAPFSIRNWNSFHSIFGEVTNFTGLRNEVISLKPAIFNSFDALSLHWATPISFLNELFQKAWLWVHYRLGSEPLDSQFTLAIQYSISWRWPGTNSAPLHLAAITLAFAWLLAKGKSLKEKPGLTIALVFLAGFVLFNAIFKWQPNARFQLPFFVVFAPLIGVLLDELSARKAHQVVVIFFFVASLPALIGTRTRPLFPVPVQTINRSIFSIPREVLYFESNEDWFQMYHRAAVLVQEAGCKEVLLRIDSWHWEYLWWVLLEPAKNGIRIEHSLVWPGLERYQDRNFRPCAVICTVCNDTSFPRDGMSPILINDRLVLYLP
jgi:4-amino-4-deoxy-L-arabinose transferase-like glycosyltransferase